MSRSVRVSVILPVRNGEHHLAQALSAIERNCTKQDELIVIDDDSNDGTMHLLQSFKPTFPVTILSGGGQGPAKARNNGLRVARGRYITFLDHDDHWPNDRIVSHLKILESDANIDVVMGKIYYFTDLHQNDLPAFVKAYPTIFHVHLGASTFRQEVFETIGFFDEDLRFSEDHDLFLRIREAGLMIYPLHEISLNYRIHENNMTRDKPMNDMQMAQVIKKSLSRRRLTGAVLSPFPKNKISSG